MKKAIKIYALTSSSIAVEFCIHAGLFYLLNGNKNKVGRDSFFDLITVIIFELTLFNGILLAIAGIYLLVRREKAMGWLSLIAVLIFYVTTLLIYFYDRPAAA
jgi:uncharacterized membrane protein YhaH (DUF805 family)